MTIQTERPTSCLCASLHYLELATPEPAVLAEFYSRTLGYRIVDESGILIGRASGRRLLFVPDSAKGLSAAGYAVTDTAELERLRRRIGDAGWPRHDGPTVMFHDAVTVRDPDGTTLCFGIPREETALEMDDGQRAARLQHAVVASRDPQRVVRFFIDILGFTLSDDVIDDAGGIRTSFLRSSSEHHSFAVFKAAENRLDHHCYETTDWNMIRDWCDHLARERVPIAWGPGRHGPGNNLFIFIHDPDGNWVELSAELEIVAHERPAGQWPHEERTLNSWGAGKLRS